jgi:hypothetical protein
MTFKIIFYGSINTSGLPVNTSGTKDQAIQTAREDMNLHQTWADRFEVYDSSGNLVFQEARQP